MTTARRDPHRMRVDMFVQGRRVLVVEDLAEQLGKSPSSVRSTIHRRQIAPAGYVTRNVPVYYPEDLGLETPT
jgi:hypoxanthine-guanine phosphoribosyltransferase